MSLYRAASDAFTGHDLSFMLDLSEDLAMILDNATKYFGLSSVGGTVEESDSDKESSFFIFNSELNISRHGTTESKSRCAAPSCSANGTQAARAPV
ncbi:MAG TPA: hypothetical protein VG498_14315, partial [Terriglobales bacterium]|nr:hypothetical protein [Terriglobales bacterium]